MKKKYIKKYKKLFNNGIKITLKNIKLLKKNNLFNKIILTADKIYNLKKKNKIIIFGNGGSGC